MRVFCFKLSMDCKEDVSRAEFSSGGSTGFFFPPRVHSQNMEVPRLGVELEL